MREILEGEEPSNLPEAESTMSRIVRHYNNVRIRCALGGPGDSKSWV
jgi:hypothetical protein